MTGIKDRIGPEVESLSEDLFAVSDFLLANPETAFKEFKARDYLSSFLEKKGFEVEKEVGGVETSFLARPAGYPQTRPTVAFLAEYDALPKIGHGCGHQDFPIHLTFATFHSANQQGVGSCGYAVKKLPNLHECRVSILIQVVSLGLVEHLGVVSHVHDQPIFIHL